MDKNKKAYLIIPKLIPQPTWGGEYIAQFKGMAEAGQLGKERLGQSYELGGSSYLLDLTTLSNEPNFEDCQNTKLSPQLFELNGLDSSSKGIYRMKDLLRSDPSGLLGAGVVDRYGPVMPLLIKFTQALGNSFQLHIKEKDQSEEALARAQKDPKIAQIKLGSWLAKPETWYFFEKGYITLGLKPGADIARYREVCEEISDYMLDLSQRVDSGLLSLDQARRMAQDLVKNKDPWQFVNCLYVEPGQIVDPSAGGIHHSWEEDNRKCPLGNIVYEVQLDRPDHLSTLRSFDKGKIKDDGTVRKIQIKEYFENLDSTPVSNDVGELIKKPQVMKQDGTGLVELLFETKDYACERICLTDQMSTYQGETRSFHHLFVKKGRLEVCPQSEPSFSVVVEQGWSVLYPAGFGRYIIGTVGGKEVEVLKTYVTG